jgi:hypothetical protein
MKSFMEMTDMPPLRAVEKTRKDVLPFVEADLLGRRKKGVEEYGEPLMTHNGRDALWDAYEEALDLVMYLRQEILERRGY